MKMPWGAYKDFEIEEIPSGYLRWLMYDCHDLDPFIKEEVEKEYDERGIYNSHFYKRRRFLKENKNG